LKEIVLTGAAENIVHKIQADGKVESSPGRRVNFGVNPGISLPKNADVCKIARMFYAKVPA
jgi:hypothetical protein